MNVSQINGENFTGRVYVPSNIKNNKQTIIGKCDLRNIAFIFIGIVIFSLCFLILKGIAPTLGVVIGIILSAPFFLLSFIKINGLKVEEYLMVFRSNKLAANNVRINSLDNIYEKIVKFKKVEKNKNEKKKKMFLPFFVKKEKIREIEEIIDTDDNLLKIQNIENKQKAKKKVKNKAFVSSKLIYN